MMLRGSARAKSHAFEIVPSVRIVAPDEASSLPWYQWSHRMVDDFNTEHSLRHRARSSVLRQLGGSPTQYASRLLLPQSFSSELLFGGGNDQSTVAWLEQRWQTLNGSNELESIFPDQLQAGVVAARQNAPYALLSRYHVPVTDMLRYVDRYQQWLMQSPAGTLAERDFDKFRCQLHLHLLCTSKQRDKEFRRPIPIHGIFRDFFGYVASEERYRLPNPYRFQIWYVQVMEAFGWSVSRQMYEVAVFDNGLGFGLYSSLP